MVAAIGGLVFLVLVCAIIACCGRRRKKKKGEKRSAQAVLSYGTCGTCNEKTITRIIPFVSNNITKRRR